MKTTLKRGSEQAGRKSPEYTRGKGVNRKEISVAVLLVIAVMYPFIEPYWIEEKVYHISRSDIPSAFNDTKIVFLTDIHHGRFFSRSRVARVVDQVNKLKPELILLGGDYVEGSPKYIDDFFEELGRLHAPVFGVLGNHDHWQGAERTRKAMLRRKIHSIDNAAFWVRKNGQRIRVGGVGDHCEDVQHLNRTVDSAELSDFVILVSHSPDYVQEIKSDKVDLVLAGHTHGGQVTFFGVYGPKVPSHYGQKFRTGSVMINKMQMIVSNGIGTTLFPIRFFARPQIVIIHLHAE